MLYVVTAVHNRKDITKAFIENLLRQTYKDWRLLIVDDGSTDGTSEMIRNLLPDAIIIYGNGHLWWGGSLHKAYKWLMKNAKDDDAVYMCNDDISIPDEYFKLGLKRLEQNNCLVSGTGYDPYTKKMTSGIIAYDCKTGKEVMRDVNSIGNSGTTHSLFFTVKVFRKVGGFHPVLLPHYGSDPEFIIRAANKGIPIKSFDDLIYDFDISKAGGIKKYNNKSKRITLEMIFSKRSTYNPFYWFSFMCLTTPLRYIPGRLAKRIIKTIKKLLKNARR